MPSYDVCIVGAGPAGLICCLELSRLNPELQILLLEYGDAEPGTNSLDASIDVRNPVNHHPPSECTNKGLGGTSATWGGRCVSYDEIDFIPRAAIGDTCTWDISVFEDVKRFYPVAAEYMECGNSLFTTEACLPEMKSRISENFVPGDITDDCLERWSMPTRFGPRYRETLLAAKNVTYVEGFEVDFLSRDLGSDGILIKGKGRSSGQEQTFQTPKIVLAAGAQEVTRLLLKNPEVFGDRPLPKSLGKYYQGHISGKIASIVFTGDPKQTDFGFLNDGEVYVRRRFQLSKDLLQRENLLSTALWLDNPLYSESDHKNGTMSFIYLMMLLPIIGKKLAPPAIAHSITKGKRTDVGAHLKNVVLGIPRSLFEPASIFLRRYMSKRKLPGVFLFNAQNKYALHFHGEQVPLEENQMSLGVDGKTLVIDYSYCDKDVESVIQTHRLLDEWLRQTNAGRLEYWYSEGEVAEKIRTQSRDGIHQAGTTRMSLEPETGVVDSQLRLWANENVFVCSSSVFPTSSQANPTFLLAAFAARLASFLAT